MREEIADLVYPVVSYGLDLKARLERGERPDFAAEQAELRNRLKTENESRKWPEYGGDGERYLGIRYALTCWLDEVLIDSPWERQWNERKLEEQLYFSNDRAERFWQQADMAQGRAETDALEAFYLCAMLGFRGEGPARPQTLHGWRDAVEEQLSRAQGKAWPGPQEKELKAEAPARRGRDRLRLVLMGLVGLLAVLIPMISYMIVAYPRLK
jgi:type VI secretion system protein ImpK